MSLRQTPLLYNAQDKQVTATDVTERLQSMKKFYVGLMRTREARVQVIPHERIQDLSHLDRVRVIRANDKDDAAKKYIEQITGGTAAIKRPSN